MVWDLGRGAEYRATPHRICAESLRKPRLSICNTTHSPAHAAQQPHALHRTSTTSAVAPSVPHLHLPPHIFRAAATHLPLIHRVQNNLKLEVGTPSACKMAKRLAAHGGGGSAGGGAEEMLKSGATPSSACTPVWEVHWSKATNGAEPRRATLRRFRPSHTWSCRPESQSQATHQGCRAWQTLLAVRCRITQETSVHNSFRWRGGHN